MQISSKGRYALRIMIDLAMNRDQGPVRVKDIAARQSISEKYLEQIIAMFNKAEYVKSVRGAQGGYLLTREPKDYTIGMILRLAEGSIAPVSCVDEATGECDKKGKCVSAMLFEKIFQIASANFFFTVFPKSSQCIRQGIAVWDFDLDTLFCSSS